jgi:hypothetical protein
VELFGRKFDGFDSERLSLSSMQGAVFGSSIDGRFTIDIETEDFVYDAGGEPGTGRDSSPIQRYPPMSLNGRVWVKPEERGSGSVEGNLPRAVVDGFEVLMCARGLFTEASGR